MAAPETETESPVVVSSDAPPAPETSLTPEQAVQPEAADGGDDDILLRWQAAEFVSHQKSSSWYLALAGVAVAVAAIIFLLTKDKISTGIVIFGALLLGIYARRQPRELEYILATHGLSIGEKYHGYEEFRSFSIVPEAHMSSAIFRPMKRFGQILTLYFPPELEDQVSDILADRLPYEDHQHDPLESLMRRIRF